MARENEARLELTAVDGMTQVIRNVQGSVQGLQKVYGQLAATMGVSLGAGAFVAFVQSGISALATLRDLSDKSGVTVEALSSLRTVAKLSGTDMDQVAVGAQKLSKAMLEVAQTGSGKSANAFRALGVEVVGANGQLRASDQVMQEVARKLFEMENGTQRVAYAQELFGKSGATLLPFLRELAETGALNAKVTTEQADAAKRFEDNLIKLRAGTGALKIALATDLLPSLNAVAEAMLRAKTNGDGFFATIGAGLATMFGGTDRHRNDKEMFENTEKLLKLQNDLDLERPGTTAYNAIKGQIDDVKALMGTTQAYRKVLDEVDAAEAQRNARRKVRVPLETGGGKEVDAKNDWQVQAMLAREKAWAEEAKAADAARKVELDARKKAQEEDDRAFEISMEKRAELAFAIDKAISDSAIERNKQLAELEQKYIEDQKRALLSATEFTRQAAANMQNTMSSFFYDVLERRNVSLADSFRQMLNRMLADLAASKLNNFLLGDYGKTGNVGGLLGAGLGKLGDIFGGGGISAEASDSAQFGFASGGSFTVGGSGGTDTTPVRFMATPGERVTVETPAQQRSGGASVINQSIQVGGNVTQADIPRILAAARQGAEQAIATQRRRGQF